MPPPRQRHVTAEQAGLARPPARRQGLSDRLPSLPGGSSCALVLLLLRADAVDAFLGRPFGIMPRHAAYAGAVFGGPALLALTWHIWRTLRRGRGRRRPSGARALWLLIVLLFTTGLDIIPALALNILRGDWTLTPDEWNDQVTSWFSTAMWIQRHLAVLAPRRRPGGADPRRRRRSKGPAAASSRACRRDLGASMAAFRLCRRAPPHATKFPTPPSPT